MKRILSFILCFVFLFCTFPTYAFAEGEGNIDNGGGGGMNGGIGGSKWSAGHEGVRVTIVRAKDNVALRTVDLSRYDEKKVKYHFGYKSKLTYKNGTSLLPNSAKYKSTIPEKALPKIISENGGNANISAIKSYFTDRQILKRIAANCNVKYETLINGDYKLLIEPIAYLTYKGNYMAMTATEAALYDKKVSGKLSYDMHSLTRKNLPLSMFLETADMGFAKYTGKKNVENSNDTIISRMGLGIVKFKENAANEDAPPAAETTAEYRVNTDVVTSVILKSKSDIEPDDTATIIFKVLGSTYKMKGVVLPKGREQIVWMKWHTPSTPQKVKITISTNRGYLDVDEVNAKIVDLNGHEPPDPTAKDRNDNFVRPNVIKRNTTASNSWGVWSGKWHKHMVERGTGKNKHKVDKGWWDYTRKTYTAKLTARMDTYPDDKAPTAKGKTMKSGYGVKVSVSGKVSSGASSAVTGGQTAIAYFPEFQYKTYWRVLDLTKGGLNTELEYKVNKYSTYGRRVHFTPLWFPDGTYTTNVYLVDAWTPAGMLSANLDDTISIKGNMYDDWHIGPQPNN